MILTAKNVKSVFLAGAIKEKKKKAEESHLSNKKQLLLCHFHQWGVKESGTHAILITGS